MERRRGGWENEVDCLRRLQGPSITQQLEATRLLPSSSPSLTMLLG
jgi:hypothetical protein